MANICDTLTELDLGTVITLSEFIDCIHWEDVGLELRVAKCDINEIKVDYHEIAYRKREMVCVWLRNGENPTLEELKQVIKRVNERHEREENRYSTATEENKAIESANKLVRLLDEWEVKNQKILTDQSRLVTELKKEEEFWFQTVKRWNDEKAEWEEGDTGKQRRDIINALQQGVNVRNAFVKNLLRSNLKGYDISNIKNEAAECILRQALMEIDIDRSQIVGIRYQEMKQHNKQVEDMRTEIIEYKKLIDERLRAYEKIGEGPLKNGIKSEKLEKLNAQLQSLQETTHKCIGTIDECDEIYQQEKDNLDDWKEELNENIQQMAEQESVFKQAPIGFYGGVTAGAVGTTSGAVIGGTIGTVILPVLGTGIGAALGGALGTLASLIYITQKGQEAHAQAECKVRSYRDTLNRGKIRLDRLNKIYAD